MGMSASQARLLSITSRLTNNEFRAQTITNSKLRLATQSQEASQKYMDALTSKKLVFGQYDANGEKTYTPLTANVILGYGDLKNQYAMVNASGQILLSGSDIKTYLTANRDYNKYMEMNGVPLVEVDNDEYADQLQTILGPEWAEYLSAVDVTNVRDVMNKLGSYLASINTVAGVKLTKKSGEDYIAKLETSTDLESIFSRFSSEDYNFYSSTEYNDIVSGIRSIISDSDSGIMNLLRSGGAIGKYVEELSNPPVWNIGDRPADFDEEMPMPDLFGSAKSLLSPQCWEDTGINGLWAGTTTNPVNEQIWHMEHVLAQYVLSSKNDVINVKGETITNNGALWGLSNGGGNGDDPMYVRDVLNKPENEELKNNIQILYYQLCKHIQDNNTNGGLTSGGITNNGTITALNNAEIGKKYTEIVGEMLTAVAKDILLGCEYDSANNEYAVKDYKSRPESNVDNFVSKYNQSLVNFVESDPTYEAWKKRKEAQETEQEKWDKKLSEFKKKVKNWLNSFGDLAIKVQKAIDSLSSPTIEVPDEKHEKYQWYKNLWNRMGAGKADNNTKELDTSNFVELEDYLLNNENWLQFALEHGIITLEQAIFFEDGSIKYPEMGQYDWVSKVYTSTVDIVSQDDEVAIAIAEVKYKNTITEIENKDKKYDQDLKKLDTEHNALQTEYESIKEVVTKNVERSFKAFS